MSKTKIDPATKAVRVCPVCGKNFDLEETFELPPHTDEEAHGAAAQKAHGSNIFECDGERWKEGHGPPNGEVVVCGYKGPGHLEVGGRRVAHAKAPSEIAAEAEASA